MPLGSFRLNSIAKAIAQAQELGWNLNTAVSVGSRAKRFSVLAQHINPFDIFFKDDGTKMYILGSTTGVTQYTLSTAWDITTASYDSIVFSVSSQDSVMTGMFIKPDGLKMYLIGNSTDSIHQYSMSTAWDLSTASYDNVSRSVSGQETTPHALFFKEDGTKMYVMGQVGDDVNEYSLSTPWALGTSSFIRTQIINEPTSTGLFFKPDGTRMYVVGQSNDIVYSYILNTAWNVTQSGFNTYSVTREEGAPQGIFFKPDGTRMYIVGSTNDCVVQYDLSTAWAPETAPGLSGTGYANVANQDTTATDISFSSDGTKMYMIGITTDRIWQYPLTTAWSVGTAQTGSTSSFLVSSQETNPFGFYFKPDGTAFYVIGQTNDTVYQYSMSTPWSISTASYASKSFSVTNQDGTPTAIVFKPDGTKMYVVGNTNDRVYQYTLGTAWDVSTASYDNKSFNVNARESLPEAIVFKPDGTKFYVLGRANDRIDEFVMSTAWDVSTASFNNKSFNMELLNPNAHGMYFRDDGQKLYVVDQLSSFVHEYNVS